MNWERLEVVLVTLILTSWITAAESKRRKNRLIVKDCGGPDRAIQVLELNAWPLPVAIRGRIKIGTTLNITEDLPPHMGAKLHIHSDKYKELAMLYCQQDPYKCHYKDVCSIMSSYFEGGCPKVLKKQGLCPSQCPFRKGLYTIEKLRFHLPDFEGVPDDIFKGKYSLRLQILNETDKRELGCIQLTFHLKRRKTRSIWRTFNQIFNTDY